MDLLVYPRRDHRGLLIAGGQSFECSLGPAGIRADKREGDGATPAGRFPLRQVWYRGDRLTAPETGLPVTRIEPDDGWCDAPEDPNYNRHVKLPYAASAEALYRDDGVYDLIVVPGHNDAPPVPGLGSAVFLHIASAGFGPTEGCVALARNALLTLLPGLTLESCMEISADPLRDQDSRP